MSAAKRNAVPVAILCLLFFSSAWPQAEWPSVGGDSANTRFSPLDQINVGNVTKLRGAWVKELRGSSRTPAVIAKEVLYINDASTIYALDARTGETKWEYIPSQAAPARGGVAVGAGMIFCGLSDAHVVALDASTGKPAWTGFVGNVPENNDAGPRVQWPGPIPAFNAKVGTIVSAPVYANGMVIVGLSGGDAGARASVSALDARTGKLVWRFYVIPTDGMAGSETWPKSGEALQQGGGAVWSQGATDLDLGMVYFGTGNVVPALGGETRAGDNLYTSSVIALDIRTGKLRWHYQLTHHDLWEMDIATPLILYPARVGGQMRRALAVARTDGYLFLLDRASGQPLHPVDERPVKQDARLKTSPTQPFPRGADRIGPECVAPENAAAGFALGCWFDPLYADKPNVLMPHLNLRQAPMSFDPQTEYFYVMAQVSPTWLSRGKDPFSLVMNRPPETSEYGLYAAIDSRTDKIVWQHRTQWGLAGGSGALTTAGGLLFHMEADGNVQADNAKTGDVLWKFQTGSVPLPGVVSFPGGVPAATYEIGNVQYLTLVTNKSLWAFVLNGSLPERAPPPPPPTVLGFAGQLSQLPGDGTGEILLGTGQSFQAESHTSSAPVKEEYGFFPTRASVKPGVNFKFTNTGQNAHTIVAEDGSWTIGPIESGRSAVVNIAKPGTYVFWSKESSWVKGQLIVRNAREPVSTRQQAARGEPLYGAYCAMCHGADLAGANGAPSLAGDSFLQRWQGRSVGELLTRVSTTMPKQLPHSLSQQNYADIVSFMIESNGFPPGEAELPLDSAPLNKILIDN